MPRLTPSPTPRITRTETITEYYGARQSDMQAIDELLGELRETLLTRCDGIMVTLTRTNEYPQFNGKDTIQSIKIDTWDIGA